jgi:hypothetical protein
VIGTKKWLFDFNENIKESVKLRDDSIIQVKGKGNLKLCIGGITQIISDVYYIPVIVPMGLKTARLDNNDLWH